MSLDAQVHAMDKERMAKLQSAAMAARNKFCDYAVQHASKIGNLIDFDLVDIIRLKQARESLMKAITNIDEAIELEKAIWVGRDDVGGMK